MTGARGPDDSRLQAYLDGELDAGMAAEVEHWLTINPGEAARVASMRRADDLLRSALAPVLAEPLPKSLRNCSAGASASSAKIKSWIFHAAAACLMLLAGGLAGWGAKSYSAGTAHADAWPVRFAERALDAHAVYAADLRHPVEVNALERDHLDSWLSRRIKHDVAAPDLSGAGFDLLGGRLLSERGRPAALYMYEDGSGKRLTVIIKPVRHDVRVVEPKLLSRDNLGALSWAEGPLVLAISGDIASDRLRGVSELVTMSLRRGA